MQNDVTGNYNKTLVMIIISRIETAMLSGHLLSRKRDLSIKKISIISCPGMDIKHAEAILM